MESKFISNFRRKQALCSDYQLQAKNVRANNQNKPSEEECRYLQMAADLEYELFQMSVGSERQFHEREKNRLDREIMRIRHELKGDSATPKSSVPNTNEAPKEDGLDRTVRTWYKEAPRHSFNEVSGMNELKKRLQSCISDSKAEELSDYLQISKLNSYFFIGPPGCGKTYIIEAFAHELMEKEYKYLSLEGSDIISRYVGDAEKIVTRLFEEAKKSAPCIVFIDEIDSVCKNRSLPNLPEYAANITTAFLTGFNQIHSSDSKVIFIGATNYPQRVDSAMLDRVEVIEVPFPDTEARKAALEKKFNGILNFDEGLTYDLMADDTVGYNYRDIDRITMNIKKEIFKEIMEIYPDQFAAIGALRNSYKYTLEKWKQVVDKFKPSPKKDILDAIAKWKIDNLSEEDNAYFDTDGMSDDIAPDTTQV